MEIARLETAAKTDVVVLSPEEVRRLLTDWATKLMYACASDTQEDMARARQIVEIVTGGKIVVSQAGPREPQKGS